MKPCPSCKFLLSGDATVCQFCKAPIVAEEPDRLTAVFTGAPPEAKAKGSSSSRGAARNGSRGVGRLAGRSTSAAASAALTAAEPGVRIGTTPDDEPQKRELPKPSPAVMKVILVLVVVGALAAGAVKFAPLLTGSDEAGDPFARPWTTYTAPDGAFTALAPGVPTTDTVALPQADGTTLTEVDYAFVTAEHSQVIVDVVPVKPDTAASPNLLQLSVAGQASRGIKVTGSTPSAFGNSPALSFSGTWQREDFTYDVEGRTFLVGDTLYVVMGTEVTGGVRTADGHYERFLESFAPGT